MMNWKAIFSLVDSWEYLIFVYTSGGFMIGRAPKKKDKTYQAKILCLDISNHKWKYLWEKKSINLNIIFHCIACRKINRKSKHVYLSFYQSLCDSLSDRRTKITTLSFATWMMIDAIQVYAISKQNIINGLFF